MFPSLWIHSPSSLSLTTIMTRFWSTMSNPTTPKVSTNSEKEKEKNPFDLLTPTGVHPLLQSASSPFFSPATTTTTTTTTFNNVATQHSDLTPRLSNLGAFPTTHLSIHAPVFNMSQPPAPKIKQQSSNSPPQTPSSRGQIHVKLIQARSLNVPSPVNSRPYVVVQFEQNEFVSRDPIPEDSKEVKGTAVTLSGTTSSTALTALGAIGSKNSIVPGSRKNSREHPLPSKSALTSSNPTNSSPPKTSAPPPSAASIHHGLFGRISPHNPVWKHEVSFDVTNEDSVITLNLYDRAAQDQGFLGTVQIKPVLIHDHTVDQWYKLRPFEDEIISGEMRVQITYEQFKTKRALTPRDFEFLKLIGRGTFGKVFQVRKRDTKRIYAMKVLSKKEIVAKKEVAHTIGERKILQRSLESPFLVGLKFSFQTDTDLYLVTDFKSGGELFWHLQRETRFTEERARFYIAELVLALEHLHKYNIVYRDLKPENILLDATGHVALCDFGLSKADLHAGELTTTFCGTTEYLAPEILLDEQGYSKIVDFWSLGVLLFEMCCGWSPFYAEDTQQMYKNICFGKIRFPKGVIGEEGKSFVKGLLNRNPKHRLGALRDAGELKEHPFFASIDWQALSLKQVTPPFKPVVESDESTNNFDPEFTSADLRDVGAGLGVEFAGDELMDEDDPSEDWVARSMGVVTGHQPNGPLGSERLLSPGLSSVKGGVLSPITNGTTHGTKAPTTRPQGIEIKRPKARLDVAGTPLTNSVQENFRGFTYHGRESVVNSMMANAAARREKELAANGKKKTTRNGHANGVKTNGVDSGSESGSESDDEDGCDGVDPEDDMEDSTKSVGRCANAKKKMVGFDDGFSFDQMS